MTLLVSIPDANEEQPLVGEMIEVEGCELGYIAEMVADPKKLESFGFGSDIVAKAHALAEANSDEKPEFPVVRVEEGWSNNKRLWDGEELANIAEQVNSNEPVGHWGHIKPENIGWEAPEPQTTWLGAFVKQEPSKSKESKGKTVNVFYAAGYNLPGAKVRTYIKSRAVRGISWLGRGREIPVPGQGVQIRGYKLLALDWARKLSEGMPTSSIAALASEQTEGGKMADVQLAAVTPEQFKKENPNGYALLVREVVEEKDTQIAEMEKKVEGAKADSDLLTQIKKMLKLSDDADPLAAITALMTKIGENAGELRDKLLAKEIAKRIPGEDDDAKKQRALALRLVTQAEMTDKVAECKDEEAAAKVIGEMVETAFNTDDMLKTLIGEMAPPSVRRRDEFRQGGEGDGNGNGASSLNNNAYVTES